MTKPLPDALTNALLLPGQQQQKRVRGYRDPLTGCFVIQIGDTDRLELPPDNAIAMAVGMLRAFGIEIAIGTRPHA